MKALLLLLLALPCSAQQVFPTDEKDSDRLRNLEFLLDKVSVLTTSMTALGAATSAMLPGQVSTHTYFPQVGFSAATFGVALGTVTFTQLTAGACLDIFVNACMASGAGTAVQAATLYLDAAYPPLSGAVALGQVVGGGGSAVCFPINYTWSPAAGVHTVAILMKCSTGTCNSYAPGGDAPTYIMVRNCR